jgi:hypothetical protein
MARTGEGGGLGARVVTHTNNPKQEPRPHAVDPGAVSRMGGALGVGANYKPLYYNKVAASNPIGPTDGMKAGPGSNRTILPSGSQSKCRPVSDPARGKPHW